MVLPDIALFNQLPPSEEDELKVSAQGPFTTFSHFTLGQNEV